MKKICTKCKQKKKVDNFYQPYWSDNRWCSRGACKQCVRKSVNRYYLQHPNKRWERRLKSTWHINLEQYQQMLYMQQHVCAICRERCKTGRHLAIDHCHNTNQIRGLLCHNCNRGLGLFKDNSGLMKTAVSYLEKYSYE